MARPERPIIPAERLGRIGGPHGPVASEDVRYCLKQTDRSRGVAKVRGGRKSSRGVAKVRGDVAPSSSGRRHVFSVLRIILTGQKGKIVRWIGTRISSIGMRVMRAGGQRNLFGAVFPSVLLRGHPLLLVKSMRLTKDILRN